MKFIQELAPHAARVGKEYNILPSLILAQACLESAYGKSGLAAKGKNLFGIKGSYEGRSVTMRTAEYKKGSTTPYYINAAFRSYPSWYESMKDLALLYCNGVSWDRAKYHRVIGEKDYKKAAKEVQTAGYATDPKYAEKLVSLIVRHNLTQYDETAPAAKGETKDYYRLMTGTFPGKAEAEAAAAKLKKEFGWVVYIKEA